MMNDYKFFGFVVVVSAAACGSSEIVTTTGSPLQFGEHTGSVIAGRFDAGDLAVDFRAEMPRALVGQVHVTIEGKTLALTLDGATGVVDFDGGGAAFSASEVGALASFAVAIEEELGVVADATRMHESVLVSAAGYFAVAPVGSTIISRTHRFAPVGGPVAISTGNDGKTCIGRNSTQTAKFTGDQGETWENWVVGSNGGSQWNGDFSGMGRCGVGSGSYDWTLDCLDHDACSRKYYSSSGAFDHNCGDEYSEAADDYTNFWKRCY